MSCGCSNKREGFNAGNPPLGFAGYPGSEYPGMCGGGLGDYGTYGGCPVKPEPSYAELVHEPGCGCQACQTPYSVAYAASPKACGCVGMCDCASRAPPAQPREIASISADIAGRDLLDVGLTTQTAYVKIPFIGVSVNLYLLMKYLVLLGVIAALAYFLFGFRLLK